MRGIGVLGDLKPVLFFLSILWLWRSRWLSWRGVEVLWSPWWHCLLKILELPLVGGCFRSSLRDSPKQGSNCCYMFALVKILIRIMPPCALRKQTPTFVTCYIFYTIVKNLFLCLSSSSRLHTVNLSLNLSLLIWNTKLKWNNVRQRSILLLNQPILNI